MPVPVCGVFRVLEKLPNKEARVLHSIKLVVHLISKPDSLTSGECLSDLHHGVFQRQAIIVTHEMVVHLSAYLALLAVRGNVTIDLRQSNESVSLRAPARPSRHFSREILDDALQLRRRVFLVLGRETALDISLLTI
jgi:hypothetical protein